MRRRRGAALAAWLLLASLAAAGCGERGAGERAVGSSSLSASASVLLERFKREDPEKALIKWVEADLNNDGRPDLIVMYRFSKEQNMMRVLLDLESGVVETNDAPAPSSDQVIQLRDIDHKPPLEFIVQGAKGAKMGFAVFRIEANRLVNLFGEGMEECC